MSPHTLLDDAKSVSSGSSGPSKGGGGYDAQLATFGAVSRYLPEGDEHQAFWWKVTGRHVARMMHEAGYPLQRQAELLLFYRFHVVPYLGPRPTSGSPSFRSRVAPGNGDGTPIGYSWRWGTGPDCKLLVRHYVEPMGPLTGTAVDPLNETAAKEMVHSLGGVLPAADMDILAKVSSHMRPNLADEATRQRAGSSMILGLEWSQDSQTVDVMATMTPRAPRQATGELLGTVFPNAMRDAYGCVPLRCLDTARDFVENDGHGRQLHVLGTTSIDCVSPLASRFKIYATTPNTTWDHIAAVMTLGGRKPESAEAMAQLKELWYGIKGLAPDFPAAREPETVDNGLRNATANKSGITFYFDIHPKYALPHVKIQVDVLKHAASDMEAINAVLRFLERRGQAKEARAYMNVLRGMVPEEDLENRRGLQAYFAFALKKGQVDVTSYFLPQVYRRFEETQAELSPPRKQRRSRFESSY